MSPEISSITQRTPRCHCRNLLRDDTALKSLPHFEEAPVLKQGFLCPQKPMQQSFRDATPSLLSVSLPGSPGHIAVLSFFNCRLYSS